MSEIQMETFRLSPLQRRLCTLQCFDLHSSYRTCCTIRIEGPLDIERLQMAFGKVIERHEILRTTFPHLPGLSLPVQVITEECSLPLSVYDISFFSSSERERILPKLLSDLQSLSLYLDDKPLLHASLIIDSKNVNVLTLLVSALSADRVSFQLLMKEASQFYSLNLL